MTKLKYSQSPISTCFRNSTVPWGRKNHTIWGLPVFSFKNCSDCIILYFHCPEKIVLVSDLKKKFTGMSEQFFKKDQIILTLVWGTLAVFQVPHEISKCLILIFLNLSSFEQLLFSLFPRWDPLKKSKKPAKTYSKYQKSSPVGLYLEFEMWRRFDTKTEIKIIYFVPLCLILLIVSDCIFF